MSNLASTLERRLSAAGLRWLRALSEVSTARSSAIYLVGGVVRDILLQRPVNDLDFSVADLDERLALDMASAVGGRLTARSQFNTFKLEVDSITIDVAMTRRESYAYPGALPDVQPGSLDQDLARRDFSVNAMAIDLSTDGWGDLRDPMGGRADLENRLIRVLHQESFADDATRIFRAVRYSKRLAFSLEEGTASLLRGSLGWLDKISGDRLRHEFQRVFEEVHPGPVLQRLDDLGVLQAAFAPLGRPKPWPDELRPADGDEGLVWLAYLACGMSSGETAQFARRLNMDSTWGRVVQDVAKVEALLEGLDSPGASRGHIYQSLHGFHLAALQGVSASHQTGQAGRNVGLYLRELRHVRTELTGRDLLALGVDEGPEVGKLLQMLLVARLDGHVSDRQGEEALVARATAHQ